MSIMIERLIRKKLQDADRSILILGPRQTGKSTLLKTLKPGLIINLARENEFLRYSADPDLFIEQIEYTKVKRIFIDEVQRIPSMLNSIQALLDDNKEKEITKKNQIQFLLSGSSVRKLKRGQANLLPGRIFSYQLSGLAAQELSYDVDTSKALKFGFLPEPYLEEDAEICQKLLTTYSATYLKEEIQAEALSRNIQGFARFLMNLAYVAGQILDFSKLSTKAKVSRSSCIRFVEILEDTLIAQRVLSFSEAKVADVIHHPKLYFFDTGVLNGLLENFMVSGDRLGILFEHLVFSQIRNSAIALDLPIKIEFFRTRHGLEVDFIVTLNGKVWAIEVKAGEANTSDLSGLLRFMEYFPGVHRCVLVTQRAKKRMKNGVLICNWITLLQEMGL